MVETIVLHTYEIDDIESAVKDIMSQLKKEKLGKSSVGIISCHHEFINSGVMEAVCNALPFEVTGAVTSSQAVNGVVDTFLLTVTVLTGDDVSFAVKTTKPFGDEPYSAATQVYTEVFEERLTAPALIFAYLPFVAGLSVDKYVNALTNVSNGVPCFGTVALDSSETFECCFVCVNGKHYIDRGTMIMVYGNIRPKFVLATISPEKILAKPALITKSEGNLVYEVNGHPIAQYFEDLGLTSARESQYAMAAVPFLIDYGDNTPLVSKAFIAHIPDKYAVCAGDVPEGSTIHVGTFDKEDITVTTGEAIDKALDIIADGATGMIIYSCITRSMSLGGEPMAELELVQSKLADKIPFVMAYSNGELCPMQIDGTCTVNRFHNNTFIACIF